MKRIFLPYVSFVMIAITTLLSGCIHTYPEPNREEDPTLVDLVIDIDFSSEWSHTTKANSNLPRRIIAVLTKNGKIAYRKDLLIESSEIPESGIIPVRFTIPDTDYNIAIWSDLVDPADKTPVGYDTENLSEIRMLHPHGLETSERDCLSFQSRLRTHPETSGKHTIERMTAVLTYPTGRFRIIASDYDSFIESHAEEIRKGENYRITVTIDSQIPELYDMLSGKPMQPADNVSFSKDLDIITVPGIEMAIASDWIFTTETPVSHSLTVTLTDQSGNPQVTTKVDSFPLEQGKITTISGNFLTRKSGGGISINDEWEGEIDIIIKDKE